MATTCMMQIRAINVYPICLRVIVCSFTMSIVYPQSTNLSTKPIAIWMLLVSLTGSLWGLIPFGFSPLTTVSLLRVAAPTMIAVAVILVPITVFGHDAAEVVS